MGRWIHITLYKNLNIFLTFNLRFYETCKKNIHDYSTKRHTLLKSAISELTNKNGPLKLKYIGIDGYIISALIVAADTEKKMIIHSPLMLAI